MELHVGRLIDHIHIIVADLPASRRFYEAVLGILGRSIEPRGDHAFSCDELFVSDAAFTRGRATGPHRVHLAFQAADRAVVERFHAAGLAAGGRDNGTPGERPYHPGYFGAFLFDPDGNNVEAVHHGSSRRSAASVVINPAG